MKPLALAAVILAMAAVGTVHAQTYSFAGYVKHGQAYFDAAATLHTRKIKGNFSIRADMLAGANVTQPSGDAGGMVDIDYDAGKGWILFAGPAYTQPLSDLSIKSFSWNNVTFAIGIRSPIDWRLIFGGSGTNAQPLGEYHVLESQ